MSRLAKIAAAAALGLGLAGCTSDDFLRTEGVTTSSGNAMAANSVMQMVDPWPYGVQDTDLRVPAVRPANEAEPAPPEDTAGGAPETYN